MTETYNGYWSPVYGDIKEKQQDAYHRYPATKTAGVLNKPTAEVFRIRTAVLAAASEK